MRYKIFEMMADSENYMFDFILGESKKRQYIASWNKEGKITGFSMFKKKPNEGYFLIYEE